MTFLELCQLVASESGVIDAGPQSVVNQTGQLGKVVGWTRDAWLRIQRMTPTWSFMQQEFSVALAIGKDRYTFGADLGLTDLAALIDKIGGQEAVTNYETALGRASEGRMYFRPYGEFRAAFDVGSPQAGRPRIWSITPSGQLAVAPVPDRAVILRGVYRRKPQTFSNNGDTPTGLDEEFHPVIANLALTELAEFDEATVTLATHTQRKREIMSLMRERYLPPVGFARQTIA